jgi:2-dehydropantoate 2-reductase
MRIVIVGAGAVGSLLGAMLARAGTEVAFVARGATRDKLRETGIHVSQPDAAYDVGPFAAEEDPALLAPADAVFLATKSFQVRAVAPRLLPLIATGGVVVPLQNGVDAPDALMESLGADAVLGGLCHVLASAVAPARVSVLGAPLRVTFGELSGGISERVKALGAVLSAAGVTVDMAPAVRVDLWEKLLFVGPMGLIGAATGLTADLYRTRDDTRALVETAMNEVRGVALADGVQVKEDAVASALARLDSLPAGSATSMQRDLIAGRHSEIEEQIGVIVRLAAKYNVDASVHETLYAVLKARAT